MAAYGELLMSSKDWVDFDDFYLAVLQNGTLFEQSGRPQHVPEGAEDSIAFVDDWVCTGPIHFTRATRLLDREIAMLKAALGDRPASDAFLTTTAPLSVEPGRAKGIYKTDEEHIYAIAEAMQVEYEAIAAAGFQVQVDDAWLGALWDRIGSRWGSTGTASSARCAAKRSTTRCATSPRSRSATTCAGGAGTARTRPTCRCPTSSTSCCRIKAQTYLIEAANVRHEHEIALWEDTKLPDGKILAPGVVTHSTPLIEHPQLVADRIERFANAGRPRERDRLHRLRPRPAPAIRRLAWAKLKTLTDGAALATTALWS